jgi:hypothetical protein
MGTETALSVLMGIGLSAACGFRVFVPLLIMSVASLSNHLTLSSGCQWIGTYPALLAFAIATIVEIAGYSFPYIDHLLDIIASPAAVAAGILVTASTIAGMDPFLRWTLAIIAGGGVAASVQAITGLTRIGSTTTTGGLANPVVAAGEAGSSFLLSVLAVTLPIVALAAIALVLTVILGPGRMLLRRLGGKAGTKG